MDNPPNNNGIEGMDSGSDNDKENEQGLVLSDFDIDLWEQIKQHDPTATTMYIDWDDYDDDDDELFIHGIDWKSEGHYFSSNTKLKKVCLSGIKDMNSLEEKLNDIDLPGTYNFEDNLCHLLKGLAQNRSIEQLDIYHCDVIDDYWLPKLAEFFQNNHNLHALQIQNCTIKTYYSQTGYQDAIADVLRNCNKGTLKEVIIAENTIDYDSAELIFKALSDKQIEVLNISNQEIKGEKATKLYSAQRSCDALSKLLMHESCKVKELHLDSINIKDGQVSTIADGLIANKALKKLTLSGNDSITALGWHMFFRLLGKAEGLDLDLLNISHNNIDDLGISDLGRVINCCKPKVLDLSYNESITPGSWARLTLMLSQSSTLTTMEEIVLSGNKIDNEGISVLGNMIKNNTSLTKLTLGLVENVTGFFGWIPFLIDLCSSPNSALVDLGLYSNDISNDGLAVLARWVANNRRLKTLDLSSNHEVTLGGWQSFFVTLRNHNSALETLDISNNVLSSQAIASLVESLGNNLKSLDLSSNIAPMGIEAIRALSTLLSSPNCSLTKLNLCWNEIKDDGVILFANALANNNSLLELRLATYDFDHVTETGWSALANILCDRTSIDTAYTSNHTLHEVLKDEEDEGNDMNVIPDDLAELLEINEMYTKSEAARVKIIKYILFEDDGDIDVGVFVGMELNEIPSAMSWMGKEKDDIGLSVLYELCKSLPCLFESNLKVVGLKRKRSE